MAISTHSAKAKGRQLQQLVADRIRKAFPFLTHDDCFSNPMSRGGEDVVMTNTTRDVFPFSVECKRFAKFAMYKIMSQAEYNAPPGTEPIVVIRGDHEKALVVMDFEAFMSLWDQQEQHTDEND